MTAVQTKTIQNGPTPKAGILEIAAYKPGKATAEGVANPVKLSSNENMLGSSAAARAAYVKLAGDLHSYPDPRAQLLRSAISDKFGLESERLIFGSGSDELFALLNQTYLSPGDNIVQGQYGFSAFAIGARAAQAEVRYAAEKDFRIDVQALLDLVDDRTRIVFLANPGNPTGTWISGSDVRKLHAGLPNNVILVLDGAYAEFVSDSSYEGGLELARDSDNIVVTRTFSKLHGLAALRVGWGFAPKAVVEVLDRIRLPFNVNSAAQAAAVAALNDEAFQKASLDLIAEWRPWVGEQLEALGLDVVPSMTNFLLVGFPESESRSAAAAERYLTKNGIIVRPAAGYGLTGHLRITIGLEGHNKELVAMLRRFMTSAF